MRGRGVEERLTTAAGAAARNDTSTPVAAVDAACIHCSCSAHTHTHSRSTRTPRSLDSRLRTRENGNSTRTTHTADPRELSFTQAHTERESQADEGADLLPLSSVPEEFSKRISLSLSLASSSVLSPCLCLPPLLACLSACVLVVNTRAPTVILLLSSDAGSHFPSAFGVIFSSLTLVPRSHCSVALRPPSSSLVACRQSLSFLSLFPLSLSFPYTLLPH